MYTHEMYVLQHIYITTGDGSIIVDPVQPI